MSLLNYGKISTIESNFLSTPFFYQYNSDLYQFASIMLYIENRL